VTNDACGAREVGDDGQELQRPPRRRGCDSKPSADVCHGQRIGEVLLMGRHDQTLVARSSTMAQGREPAVTGLGGIASKLVETRSTI